MKEQRIRFGGDVMVRLKGTKAFDIETQVKQAQADLKKYYEHFPNKKRWTDAEVREEILSAMQDCTGLIGYRRWMNVVLHRMAKKGIHPAQASLCIDDLIQAQDPTFMGLRIGICINGSVRKALRGLRTEPYDSFEEFYEAFVAAYRPIIKSAFVDEFEGEFDVHERGEEIIRSKPFRENLANWAELLKRIWSETQQETLQSRAIAEEIQYRRLERAERHRLKRLAQEEAAKKAQAEAEAKAKSEEARLAREARKAEARERAREANERAREKAAAKRAEWLAAHPPKRPKNHHTGEAAE